MSAEATSTATPPAGTDPPAPPDVTTAPPPLAEVDVPSMSVSDFEAYKAESQSEIAKLQAQISAAAPKVAASEYVSHIHTDAVRQFGEGADPALLNTYVDHTQAINALDYQLAHERDATKRAELRQSIRTRRGHQSSARASILMLQRDAQHAREQSQEAAPPKAQPQTTDLASIPMATLQNQSKVMPVLEADCPLVAAALASGDIKYNDLLARIRDPTNNPAAQWNSIMSGVENQLATGTFVATPAPANGATPPVVAPLVAGMPPANGGQSSMPKPATTESERKAADAAHVARMRAAH